MTDIISDRMREFAAGMKLNSSMQSIDKLLQDEFPGQPELQMGVLMMAQAMAFARIRRKHGITGKRRKIILDRALGEFADKIKKFGYDDRPAPAAPAPEPAGTGQA